jgi:hypothetical protein
MRNYDPKATQFFLKPYGFKFRINWEEVHIYERKEREARKGMNIKKRI